MIDVGEETGVNNRDEGMPSDQRVYFARSALIAIRKPTGWFGVGVVASLIDTDQPEFDLAMRLIAYCALLIAMQVLRANLGGCRICSVSIIMTWIWIAVRGFLDTPRGESFAWLSLVGCGLMLSYMWVFKSIGEVCRDAEAQQAARAWNRAAWAGAFAAVPAPFLTTGHSESVETFLIDHDYIYGLLGLVGATALILLLLAWTETVSFAVSKAAVCPSCYYDLRGLDAGVCPECGARLRPEAAGRCLLRAETSRISLLVGTILSVIVLLIAAYVFAPSDW